MKHLKPSSTTICFSGLCLYLSAELLRLLLFLPDSLWCLVSLRTSHSFIFSLSSQAQHKHFSALPPTAIPLLVGLLLLTSSSFLYVNPFIRVHFVEVRFQQINLSVFPSLSPRIFHSELGFLYPHGGHSPTLHSFTPPCLIFHPSLPPFFPALLTFPSALRSSIWVRQKNALPRFFSFTTAVFFITSTDHHLQPPVQCLLWG